jgi:hypothetical protein
MLAAELALAVAPGTMSHEDTVDNLTLFSKEVLPRLKEYKQPVAEGMAAA